MRAPPEGSAHNLARVSANDQPTPWLGLTERIDVGAFLLWVVVLAISLWRPGETTDVRAMKAPGPGALQVRGNRS